MAQGKKTSVEDKGAIIVGLLEGKLGSDIAKEVGVHESTVSRIKDRNMQELASENEIIGEIIENDLVSVKNMSLITKRFTQETLEKEELDRNDVSVANTTTESAFKRSQIFQNRPTDINKIDISEVSKLSPEELKKVVFDKIG